MNSEYVVNGGGDEETMDFVWLTNEQPTNVTDETIENEEDNHGNDKDNEKDDEKDEYVVQREDEEYDNEEEYIIQSDHEEDYYYPYSFRPVWHNFANETTTTPFWLSVACVSSLTVALSAICLIV